MERASERGRKQRKRMEVLLERGVAECGRPYVCRLSVVCAFLSQRGGLCETHRTQTNESFQILFLFLLPPALGVGSATMAEQRAPTADDGSTYDVPTGMDVAVLACGCFWGAEKGFWRLPGVHSTEVGYAGGSEDAPI